MHYICMNDVVQMFRMCVCMDVCINVVSAHSYLAIIHTYIYIYIYTYIQACVCIHIHKHADHIYIIYNILRSLPIIHVDIHVYT
jgi:hypothetical protein